MDVCDGFIVGIYNYCDRWCERCSLTSYCSVFATRAEAEALLDPQLKAIAEAPPLPEEVPPAPPAWLQELLDDVEQASLDAASGQGSVPAPRALPAEHRAIQTRAEEYARRAHEWLTARQAGSDERPTDGHEVIDWFHMLIAVKIHRALSVRPGQEPEDPGWPSDRDGSAKVALLGMDRSRAAWRDLADRGLVAAEYADRFIADLMWLEGALERARPKARAFVRPAFDEPEEVARLLATEGWR